MSDTHSVSLFNVQLSSARGQDVISVQVPEHEIKVLRVIHGGNVHVNGDAGDSIDLPMSSADEYGRLQRKYRQPGSADPVRHAFPQGPQDLGRFGFDARGQAAVIPQSSVKNHRKPAPKKADAKK